MTDPSQYPTPRTNAPTVAALSAAVVMLGLVVGLVIMLSMGERLNATNTPLVVSLIGVVVTVVPALVSAAFAERASKDIRNGTLVAKSQEGAARALVEHGPAVAKEGAVQAIEDAQVMTRTGPVVTAELVALTKILGHIDRLSGETPSAPPATPEDGDPARY